MHKGSAAGKGDREDSWKKLGIRMQERAVPALFQPLDFHQVRGITG